MARQIRNLFEMVPRQRRPCHELGDGSIEVLLPRYGDGRIGGILKWVFSDKPIRVHLDDIGAAVWRLCDGNRSVREIGESLREEFGDRIEPTYDRLEQFLEQMRRRGMIEWTP